MIQMINNDAVNAGAALEALKFSGAHQGNLVQAMAPMVAAVH